MSKKIKHGQIANKSGQFYEIGLRGELKREITVVKGKLLPPTEKRNSTFILVDPTKNISGQ